VNKKQDLVVIGGGAGGLVVASVAAQLGLRVTLTEKASQLGGDCLHSGCIPSKTLIHSARVAHLMRHAGNYGLPASSAAIDFGSVIDRVNAVIGRIQLHDDPERFRGYGCDVRFGTAHFTSSHEVAVGDDAISAKRFVIATGSQPVIPPVPGLEEAGYFTNETIFKNRVLPKRLAVIGGGPIGMELAQAFSRLGSEVTVIESAPSVLLHEDTDVSLRLVQILEREGIEVRLDCGLSGVRRDGDCRQLTLSDGSTVECEGILVATGRKPAVHGLGLDKAGIDYTKKGITVDRRLRTSQRHIYAVGDVCGPYQFTHMAEYQAGIALANLAFRIPKKVDYTLVPRVTYTDPEIAQIGLTEAEAQARGLKYQATSFPFTELDRAITENTTEGFAKILVHRKRIIGASLIGAHAGELIHELALAMHLKAKASDVANMIHAYPTYSLVHRRVINRQYAHLLQSGKVRLLVRMLNRLIP